MDGTQIRALIQGYLNATEEAKQRLGRCFAAELGLQPGNRGPDGGIDGSGYSDDGRKIYFQCRLSSKKLGKQDADEFYKKIKEEQADIGIMLAGVGYTNTFVSYQAVYPEIENASIHLLTLKDILEKSLNYENTIRDLPSIKAINNHFY